MDLPHIRAASLQQISVSDIPLGGFTGRGALYRLDLFHYGAFLKLVYNNYRLW